MKKHKNNVKLYLLSLSKEDFKNKFGNNSVKDIENDNKLFMEKKDNKIKKIEIKK